MTRERILSEAAKLFDEKGFGATTVDEIVRRADVSKGTFFNYFSRKDQILASVIERRHEAAQSAATEILSLATPVRDKVLAIFAEAAVVWEQDRAWSRHILGGLHSESSGSERGDAARDAWREAIQSCVDQGRKSGELRGGIAPARAEAMLSGVFREVLERWAARDEFDLQEEVRETILLALDGLAE